LNLLFIYTVRFDTGFASRIDKDGRYLTLAARKPRIRSAAAWRMALRSWKNCQRRALYNYLIAYGTRGPAAPGDADVEFGIRMTVSAILSVLTRGGIRD